MFHKTIIHTIPSGKRAKFTIRSRQIDGRTYYYANVINIDLDFYKNLSNQEKEVFYGMEITDGNQNSINYTDLNALEEDILSKYGEEWLETEK